MKSLYFTTNVSRKIANEHQMNIIVIKEQCVICNCGKDPPTKSFVSLKDRITEYGTRFVSFISEKQ